jgi:hypothetical protein
MRLARCRFESITNQIPTPFAAEAFAESQSIFYLLPLLADFPI